MEENDISKNTEETAFLSRYDTVLSFLSLEVLCLGTFALGGALGLTIFRILSLFLSVITIGFLFNNYRAEEKKRYWICLIPFFCLALLLGLSRFFLTSGTSLFSNFVNGLVVSVGLVGFFLLGQGVKSIPVLKKDIILLCLGGTLALMVLIPGFYSLIRYGFFYAQRYKGMVYYYDGVVFQIANETKALSGFSFLEVSLSYGKLASFLLSLAAIPCMFISPKKETKRFLCFLGFGLFGLFDLIIVPFWLALILVAFIYLLALIYRLVWGKVQKDNSQEKADKVLKICFFVLIGLVLAGLLVLTIDALTNSIISKLPIKAVQTSRSGGILSRIANAIRGVFLEESDSSKKLNLLGMLFGVNSTYASGKMLTRVFEFSLLWENGLIAFALFLYCAFFMIKESHRFLVKGNERIDYKIAIVALLLGLFLYLSIFNDEQPVRHSEAFSAWSRGSFPMLACFASGLIYTHKEKEAAHE